MADRMEREIEEILSKLDVDAPKDRAPISIMSRRGKSRPPDRVRPGAHLVARAVSPATLLVTGALVMIAGLILSNVWGPLIWAAFGGVVIFLAAFALSFMRTRPAAASAPSGHYWRDRYIEYTPTRRNVLSRLKQRFRR